MAETVDVRGLSCPVPVIRTKAALERSAEDIVVLLDDAVAKENVSRLARSRGCRVEVTEDGADYRVTLRVPVSRLSRVS